MLDSFHVIGIKIKLLTHCFLCQTHQNSASLFLCEVLLFVVYHFYLLPKRTTQRAKRNKQSCRILQWLNNSRLSGFVFAWALVLIGICWHGYDVVPEDFNAAINKPEYIYQQTTTPIVALNKTVCYEYYRLRTWTRWEKMRKCVRARIWG